MKKRIEILINSLLLLTIGAAFLFFVTFAVQTHFEYPFADQIDSYRMAFDFLENSLTLDSFFASHNEHRPYVQRLITIYSANYGGGSSTAELFVLIGIYILIYISASSMLTPLGNGEKIIGLFFFALLVFNPAGAINWYWDFMIGMPIALFFVLLGFIVASKGAIVLPSFFFLCALFSQAIGLFGSLALSLAFLIAYLTSGRFIKLSIYWLIFFLITLFLYLQNLPYSVKNFDILNSIKYTLVFIGKIPYSLLYFPNSSMWGYPKVSYVEIVLGATFLCAYLYMLFADLYSGFNFRKISYHSCVMFVLIAALLLSISRGSILNEGPSHANAQPTYLLSSFFYIGFFLIFCESKVFSISKNKHLLYFAIVLLPFTYITRYHSSSVMNEIIHFKQTLQMQYTSPVKNEARTIVFPNAEIGYNFIIEYCARYPRCDL
jgi:hypothetical protein